MHDLERETAPPPELKGRVTRTLRARGLLDGSRRPLRRPAVRIAAALALVAGGWLLGRWTPAAAPGAGEPYLLVLHEDERFLPARPPAELVREYTQWAGALRERGALIAAEPLDGWSATLPRDAGSDAEGPALGPMTGFFLVRAEDREAAVELAGTHPHLGYGGSIRVLGTGAPE